MPSRFSTKESLEVSNESPSGLFTGWISTVQRRDCLAGMRRFPNSCVDLNLGRNRWLSLLKKGLENDEKWN